VARFAAETVFPPRAPFFMAETARADALRLCAAPAHVGRGDVFGHASWSTPLQPIHPSMSAESQAWRATDSGYVLMPPGDRQASEPARYMLHHSACVLLVSTSGALQIAGQPTWRGTERDLIEWTTQETGSPPAFCPTCMS
jgi:hypothetical protein